MSAPLMTGNCVGGSGPDLARHPNLTCGADGVVRTHLAGRAVDEVAADLIKADLVGALDCACGVNGVTLDELCDAIRYARATGAI